MINFRLPYRGIVGSGALAKLPEVLEELSCKKVLVVTDPNVYSILGKRISEVLSGGGVTYEFSLIEDSNLSFVEKARVAVRRGDICGVVGFGGGRPIDVAKYAAYLENRVFISVPTAISHDGMASPTVSLKDPEGLPLSVFTRPPRAIIADTGIISKAPVRLLRSGFGDIIGKYTSVRDARLAKVIKNEDISEISLELAYAAAEMAAKNVDKIAKFDQEGVSILVEAALMSGLAMDIANSSRPCSGSEHMFSHALDKVYPEKKCLHGEQVGIGTILMAYVHGIDWKRIKMLLKTIGAPTSAEELGVPSEAVIEALSIAHRMRKRYTILGDTGLSREAAKRIAKETGVIG